MSKELTTEQMNQVIAVFMGWEFIKGDPNHKCNFCFAGDEPCTPALDRFVKDKDMRVYYEFKYHSSWDWLILVVEKIEKLQNGRFGFTIDPWGIDIIDYKGAYDGHGEKVIVNVNREPSESTLLNDYYDAVCQFIQWYNDNKQ